MISRGENNVKLTKMMSHALVPQVVLLELRADNVLEINQEC
jgi:hypothetical protein